MAVKGKKKSQSRGAQGRRGPAAAPRTTTTAASRRVPWYHTQQGRVGIGIALALLIGLVWWIVATTQGNARELESRQDGLEKYTGQVRAMTQSMSEAGAEMAAVAPTLDEAGAKKLKGDSARWAIAFTAAQAKLATIVPPGEDAAQANTIFQEALQLYDAAARAYALAPQAEGELRLGILTRAAAQKDRAISLWGAAIGILDRTLDDAELEASGLTAPGAGGGAGTPLPTDLPTGG